MCFQGANHYTGTIVTKTDIEDSVFRRDGRWNYCPHFSCHRAHHISILPLRMFLKAHHLPSTTAATPEETHYQHWQAWQIVRQIWDPKLDHHEQVLESSIGIGTRQEVRENYHQSWYSHVQMPRRADICVCCHPHSQRRTPAPGQVFRESRPVLQLDRWMRRRGLGLSRPSKDPKWRSQHHHLYQHQRVTNTIISSTYHHSVVCPRPGSRRQRWHGSHGDEEYGLELQAGSCPCQWIRSTCKKYTYVVVGHDEYIYV